MQTFYLEKWKMYEAYYEKAAGQIFKKSLYWIQNNKDILKYLCRGDISSYGL